MENGFKIHAGVDAFSQFLQQLMLHYNSIGNIQKVLVSSWYNSI